MSVAAELEITIARSATAVFDDLITVERFPEWLVASGITSVERLEIGPLVEGSRVRIGQRIAGRATTLDGIVTVLEPTSRFAFRATDRDGVSVEADARLASDGAVCRLRWSVRIGLPLRYRPFEPVVRSELQRAAAADLERLRRRLESVAG